MTEYHTILQDYLQHYALPGMLAQGWAFKPAKSSDRDENRRANYHIDQSLRTHILNGLYALTHVLEYLDTHHYRRLSPDEFKRTLVLYTLHDAYKDIELAETLMDKSDYSIPLISLEALIEEMHLRDFAPVSVEDVRLASVSTRSSRVGDLASSTPGTDRLLDFVHLADALASQQSARDYSTAEHYLLGILGASHVAARHRARVEQRLDDQIPPASQPPPKLAFCYHEVDDYRGLSTLVIHQATQEILAAFGLYPILYFANGVLYLGPADVISASWEEAALTDVRRKIGTAFFTHIRDQASEESLTVARDALGYGKALAYSKEVFLFSRLDDLLEGIRVYPLTTKPAGFVSRVVKKRVATRKYAYADEFYARYQIPKDADEDDAWAGRWNAVFMLLMGIESLAKALVPASSLDWLLETFRIPPAIAATIKQHASLLHVGGVSDHCLIIAYHWLTEARFLAEKRTAREVDLSTLQHAVITYARQALKDADTEDRRLAYIDAELGLRDDLDQYVRSMLLFSFAPTRLPEIEALPLYEKARSRSHKRQCVICNRLILPQVKNPVILTDIAEQQAHVFSNRLLPADEVIGQMVWCPLCYLEFLLRKLSGQRFPVGSDAGVSRRLYLYVLPDYSFTPQLWNTIGEALLSHFYGQETVVTRLPLRGSREEPALPTKWLEQHQVDEQWLAQVQAMFVSQAERMALPPQEGKPRSPQGDRITFSFKAPNYLLITYSTAVPKQLPPQEKARIAPTVVEMWAKAFYAAALIHLLTGARVYVTEKPYLSISRPEEMKTIIELDGVHPLLAGLLPLRLPRESGETAGAMQTEARSQATVPLNALPIVLDALAAVWEINAALTSGKTDERRNRDKRIAEVLEQVRTNPFAGATLYKMRARKKAGPYPALTLACQILMPTTTRQGLALAIPGHQAGYQFMLDQVGGDLMNLAQQVTDISLQLFLPSTGRTGRAHRYERIFRTGIDAMKSSARIPDEELLARVGGAILKRLDRMSGGRCPTYGEVRLALVEQLSSLLVEELFRQRCGGSASTLTHEENRFADAVYFLTALQIRERWETYQQQNPHLDLAPLLAEEAGSLDDLLDEEEEEERTV